METSSDGGSLTSPPPRKRGRGGGGVRPEHVRTREKGEENANAKEGGAD